MKAPRSVAGGTLAGLVGVAVGVGAYTFAYGRGASYLSNDPAACVNCHVMRPQYNGWLQGSHRMAATCNDCHTPKSVVPKYLTKGRNGFWHSYYFTTGTFVEPIRITPRNRAVTEERCRTCHAAVVARIAAGREPPSCVRCHSSVGHRT